MLDPLEHQIYIIVGVAPAGFAYPVGAEYWTPMWYEWESGVGSFAVGRLAPGATVAGRAMSISISRIGRTQTSTFVVHVPRRSPIRWSETSHQFSPCCWGAVSVLLLIACLNVGNLLLLRTSGRAREIAVRRALGASSADIGRQLFVEAIALAATGGAFGFLIAVLLLHGLIRLHPSNLPRLDAIQLSGAPFATALGISSLAVLAFGLLPTLLVARTNLATPLRFDARSGDETRRRRSLRQALVASQVGLATIMLGGAGLLARSLARLEMQDTGYNAEHLSVLTYTWNAYRYDSVSKMLVFTNRLLANVQRIPGVTAATPLIVPPLIGDAIWQVRFDKDSQTPTDAESNPFVPAEIPGPDFFRTFGVSLVRGRGFTDRDDASSQLVVVVSEAFARRYWPNDDPGGKRIRMWRATTAGTIGGDAYRTVVGVARDTHLRTIKNSSPIVYVPFRQAGDWQGSVAIRSSIPLNALLPALRLAGHETDPETELFEPQTMDQLLGAPMAQPRLSALLMSSFGLVALLLAAIGLYGVMAALVRDQTREIGIRIALGASPSHVRRDVLRSAAIVTGAGAAGRPDCGRRGISRCFEFAVRGESHRPSCSGRSMRHPARDRRSRRIPPSAPRHAHRSRASPARRLTMTTVPRWRRYLRFFGANVHADVDDELAFHMEMRMRDYESRGMSRAEAERAARERFGDVGDVHQQLTQHDHVRQRRMSRRDHMDRIAQDLRFVLRGFRRTPGFFVTAVLILGLGIGMSVAMFTVFRTVLVQRLPVIDQDRIAVMWTYRTPGVEYAGGTKELAVVKRESKTMRDIAAVAHYPAEPHPFRDGNRAIAMNRAMVTGNFFTVLGARPVLGRLLTPQDDDVGAYEPSGNNASKVLVLSYKAWKSRFGGDSSVIGRKLIDEYSSWPYTIVGVAPPGLNYPDGVEYWIPTWGGWSGETSSFAVARVNAGSTLSAARDEYFSIEDRLAPQTHLRGADVKSFSETVLGNVQPILTTLSVAVALLLLIACLNVGNLLLLRASGRAREIAVRRALGAGFGDIVRQQLVESIALATAGGLLGFATALGLLRTLVAYSPRHLPRLDDVSLSGAPISIAIVVSTACVLLFGIAPALLAGRANLATPLRTDSRSGAETKRRRAVRQLLVASQVALAMIMLGGAALLARSLARLENQDAGYVAEHVSYLSFTWSPTRIDSETKLLGLIDRLIRQLQAVPGVTAVSTTNIPPLLGLNNWQSRFDKPEQAEGDAIGNPVTPWEAVGPDFFRVLRIPITRGRAFTDQDRATSARVMIVSQSIARRYWPNEDPPWEAACLQRPRPERAPSSVDAIAHGRWRRTRHTPSFLSTVRTGDLSPDAAEHVAGIHHVAERA